MPAVILSERPLHFILMVESQWMKLTGSLLMRESIQRLLTSINMLLCVFFFFPDLLAVPKHPYAAMENWGLSVFVEQKILLDAEVSSSSYQMELTMVVVHEICHQVGTFNRFKLTVGFKSLTPTASLRSLISCCRLWDGHRSSFMLK